MSTNQIFISYSHKDKDWLDTLKISLKPYLREDDITAWADTEINVGADWQAEIMRAMAATKIAVLLVTPDFLASDFIYKHELPYLLQAAKEQKVKVIPVAVRYSSWEQVERLSALQWANNPAKPLALLTPGEVDQELVRICKLIAKFFPETAIPETARPEDPKEDQDPEKVVKAVSQSAEEGLKVLISLMGNADVKAKVATFEADFANASEQIELLGYYKDLHDILHELQFACYNYLTGIIRDAKSDPDNPSIWDNVVNYELSLREKVVTRLHRVGERNPSGHSKQDWIPRLLGDLDALFEAIEQNDAFGVEKAIKPIQRVLAQKPVPINASLATAAEALRLSRLVVALTDVSQCLNKAQLNSEKVNKFTDGVKALNGLKESLNGLKDSHNEWQEVDGILRLVDGSIAIDDSELKDFWPELKQKIEKQCEGFDEDWAALLRKEIEKLEKAMAEADSVRIRRCFQSLKSRANSRFYQVDLALKEVCEQLRKVGEPLTKVWEMIK